MRVAVALACLACLHPVTGMAGAWPKGKGNGFLSLSYEWTTTEDDLLRKYFGKDVKREWWEDDRLQELSGKSVEEIAQIYPEYAPVIDRYRNENPFIPPLELVNDLALSDDCAEIDFGDQYGEIAQYVGCDPRGAYVLTLPEARDFSFQDYGFTSLYFEYGLTDRLTVGVDAGSEDTDHAFQWIAFLSASLVPQDWRFQASVEVGAGMREYTDTYYFGSGPDEYFVGNTRKFVEKDRAESVLRPGLLMGFGFDSWLGPGWATLDLRQEVRERNGTAKKADVTVGVNREGGHLMYLQAQYSDYPGNDPNLRLVPTFVYRLTDHFSIESALLYDAWGSGDRIGLRAGVWFDF